MLHFAFAAALTIEGSAWEVVERVWQHAANSSTPPAGPAPCARTSRFVLAAPLVRQGIATGAFLREMEAGKEHFRELPCRPCGIGLLSGLANAAESVDSAKLSRGS